MWEIWKKIFVEVLDKHAPLQYKKIRSKKVPWITSDIKKLINTRDKLKRKSISTNLENDWFDYKTSRNKVNIELRNAKKEYYSSKIAGQKFNPKKASKSINNLLGRQNKPTVVNEINLGGKNFTTPKDIAEGFNDYFSNIGPDLASKIDTSNYNLKHILKLLNQNLLHSSLLLSVMSVVSCMDFPAIKPLALTTFLVKLLR